MRTIKPYWFFLLLTLICSIGYVIFSLSSRGFFHIKSAISDEKYIKIAEKIVGVLERENLIEYENVSEDNDSEEENIYVDL